MKAGIACDEWKVPYFEKMLKKQKFRYTVEPGVFKGTKNVVVVTTRMESLALYVKGVNDHCADIKRGYVSK